MQMYIQRSVPFQTFQFASDMGGMLGLCIGLSSLSLVQILEFILHAIKIKLQHSRGSWPPKANSVSPNPEANIEMQTPDKEILTARDVSLTPVD